MLTGGGAGEGAVAGAGGGRGRRELLSARRSRRPQSGGAPERPGRPPREPAATRDAHPASALRAGHAAPGGSADPAQPPLRSLCGAGWTAGRPGPGPPPQRPPGFSPWRWEPRRPPATLGALEPEPSRARAAAAAAAAATARRSRAPSQRAGRGVGGGGPEGRGRARGRARGLARKTGPSAAREPLGDQAK
ncbi:hypothetical protein AAY473_037476 [Plecturocebus cupreus]